MGTCNRKACWHNVEILSWGQLLQQRHESQCPTCRGRAGRAPTRGEGLVSPRAGSPLGKTKWPPETGRVSPRATHRQSTCWVQHCLCTSPYSSQAPPVASPLGGVQAPTLTPGVAPPVFERILRELREQGSTSPKSKEAILKYEEASFLPSSM